MSEYMSQEIRELRDEIVRLYERPTLGQMLASLGSASSLIGDGYLGPRVKRVLVDGEEIKQAEWADPVKGYVIFALTPLQIRPGTNEIWRDIKCGKVTIEYEGESQ